MWFAVEPAHLAMKRRPKPYMWERCGGMQGDSTGWLESSDALRRAPVFRRGGSAVRSRLQVIRFGRRPRRGPRDAHAQRPVRTVHGGEPQPLEEDQRALPLRGQPVPGRLAHPPPRSTPSAARTPRPCSTASPPTMDGRPPTGRRLCCARSTAGRASTITGCATRSVSGSRTAQDFGGGRGAAVLARRDRGRSHNPAIRDAHCFGR